MKQIITSNKTILAAALLTLGLTGCALTPATENLNYTPQANVQRIAGAENISVNVVTTDSRVDKKIGNKINTFGMKMADISADEPVSATVNNAMAQELKSHGFHADQNSKLKVTADVTKFYSDTTQGWHMHNNATVNIAVAVNNSGSTIYSHLFIGNGETETGMSSNGGFISTKDIADSLKIALANAMTNIFNDKDFIAALLSEKSNQGVSN
jgi:uncharacterized lipoprotein